MNHDSMSEEAAKRILTTSHQPQTLL